MRRVVGAVAVLTALVAVAFVWVASAADAEEGATPLTGVVQVVLGNVHTCVLFTSGQASCWGGNNVGQLGDGTTTDRGFPMPVLNGAGTAPLSGIVELAASSLSTCARLVTGQVRCWGDGLHGTVGDNQYYDSALPRVVLRLAPLGRLRRVTQIVGGGDSMCALKESGQLRCWGANGGGQLGDGTTTDRLAAVMVKGVNPEVPVLRDITQAAGGSDRMCAAMQIGEARCWGYNTDSDVLTTGDVFGRTTPVPVRAEARVDGNLGDVAQISVGGVHSCALLGSGEVRCWGSNHVGQLGDGDTVARRPRPVPVRGVGDVGHLTGVTQIAGKGSVTCGILVDTRLACWGDNSDGLIGSGDPPDFERTPVLVSNPDHTGDLEGVTQIAAAAHLCALLSSGQVACWGDNYYGQLGDGTHTDQPLPVIVDT